MNYALTRDDLAILLDLVEAELANQEGQRPWWPNVGEILRRTEHVRQLREIAEWLRVQIGNPYEPDPIAVDESPKVRKRR